MNLGTSNITYDSHKKKERKKLLQPKPKVLFRGAFVLFWVGHLGWFFFLQFSQSLMDFLWNSSEDHLTKNKVKWKCVMPSETSLRNNIQDTLGD